MSLAGTSDLTKLGVVDDLKYLLEDFDRRNGTCTNVLTRCGSCVGGGNGDRVRITGVRGESQRHTVSHRSRNGRDVEEEKSEDSAQDIQKIMGFRRTLPSLSIKNNPLLSPLSTPGNSDPPSTDIFPSQLKNHRVFTPQSRHQFACPCVNQCTEKNSPLHPHHKYCIKKCRRCHEVTGRPNCELLTPRHHSDPNNGVQWTDDAFPLAISSFDASTPYSIKASHSSGRIDETRGAEKSGPTLSKQKNPHDHLDCRSVVDDSNGSIRGRLACNRARSTSYGACEDFFDESSKHRHNCDSGVVSDKISSRQMLSRRRFHPLDHRLLTEYEVSGLGDDSEAGGSRSGIGRSSSIDGLPCESVDIAACQTPSYGLSRACIHGGCESCAGAIESEGYLPSSRTSRELYRQYAQTYFRRFRAAIDYQYEEKPRQILCGSILIILLVLLSFSPIQWHDELSPSPILPFSSPVLTFRPPSSFSSLSSQRLTIHNDQSPSISFSAGGLNLPLLSILHQQFSTSLFGSISVADDEEIRWSSNVRQVIVTVTLCCIFYCFLQTKDGLLVRPHPGFWRMVHAIGIIHFFFMATLLALDPDKGRMLMEVIFPSVRKNRLDNELFAGTLEMDCSVNFETAIRQLKTPWFVSHVIGWLVKMCIYRDWCFCLLYSCSFELCELSFSWLIPELKECWWDSILLDFLVANMFGMLLGVVFLRWLNTYQYDWVGTRPLYKKVLVRFMPFTWSEYHWSFFKSPSRLLQSAVLLVLSILTELNTFFLIYSLNMPAGHWIHPFRLLYICALAVSAVAEHYEYMNSGGQRIGHNAWLLIVIVNVEVLVCIKYGMDQFIDRSLPAGILFPWCSSFLLFGTWCYFHFTVKPPPPQNSGRTECSNQILSRASHDVDQCKSKAINRDIHDSEQYTDHNSDCFSFEENRNQSLNNLNNGNFDRNNVNEADRKDGGENHIRKIRDVVVDDDATSVKWKMSDEEKNEMRDDLREDPSPGSVFHTSDDYKRTTNNKTLSPSFLAAPSKSSSTTPCSASFTCEFCHSHFPAQPKGTGIDHHKFFHFSRPLFSTIFSMSMTSKNEGQAVGSFYKNLGGESMLEPQAITSCSSHRRQNDKYTRIDDRYIHKNWLTESREHKNCFNSRPIHRDPITSVLDNTHPIGKLDGAARLIHGNGYKAHDRRGSQIEGRTGRLTERRLTYEDPRFLPSPCSAYESYRKIADFFRRTILLFPPISMFFPLFYLFRFYYY